jgi:hypothetical protein
MTDPNPVIDLTDYITLNINDDGLKVSLIPADGGIAVCLTMATDLRSFVVGLGRDDIKTIYHAIDNVIALDDDQYRQAYDNLVRIAEQEGVK